MHKVDRRMFVIVLSHPLLPPKKKKIHPNPKIGIIFGNNTKLTHGLLPQQY